MDKYTIFEPTKSPPHFLGVTEQLVTLRTWPYRRWREQAQRLHPHSPEQQQHAIAEHIAIAMHLTTSPARWLWLAEMSSRLAEEGV